jgi:hypothetical protein
VLLDQTVAILEEPVALEHSQVVPVGKAQRLHQLLEQVVLSLLVVVVVLAVLVTARHHTMAKMAGYRRRCMFLLAERAV